MKHYIIALVAFLQVVLISAGVIPYDKSVNYGGTAYVEPVVTTPINLVDNGVSDYRIVVPADASAVVKTAANELQTYVEKISGAKLPIYSDFEIRGNGKEILLDFTSRTSLYADIDRAAIGADGFILKAVGQNLIIAGGDARGTLYGVNTLLEEYFGCRWFTPKLEVVPSKPTLTVDAKLSDIQHPSFEVRRNSCSGTTAAHIARMKMNTTIGKGNENYGGGLAFVVWDVTLPKLVPDLLFVEHPEYFAYITSTGSRSTEHVCLSNPDVLTVAVENARQLIREDTRGANHFHIGQKDNTNYCCCEKCTELYEKYGSVSAPTIMFTNKLAEALADEFPNFYFTFYSYNETRRPPKDMSLRCNDNVIPVLCGLHQACRCHSLTECGEIDDSSVSSVDLFVDSEPEIAKDFADWTKVASRTYIYDYTINFLNTAQFFSNFETLQSTMKYMKDIGITGYVYNCGDAHLAAFNEMRNYLMCKLQWDVDADVAYHMLDFMSAYYGEAAAPYIKEIIDIQTAKIRATAHAFDFDWHYQSGFYSLSEIRKLNTLWEKALAASGSEAQHFNVETAQLSWRYFKANLFYDEFNPLNLNRKAEIEKLYDDFLSHGVPRVTSFGEIPKDKSTVDFNQRPFEWR